MLVSDNEERIAKVRFWQLRQGTMPDTISTANWGYNYRMSNVLPELAEGS